jgi:hypothetical protein
MESIHGSIFNGTGNREDEKEGLDNGWMGFEVLNSRHTLMSLEKKGEIQKGWK